MPKTAAARDVLDFWFDESKPEQWHKTVKISLYLQDKDCQDFV